MSVSGHEFVLGRLLPLMTVESGCVVHFGAASWVIFATLLRLLGPEELVQGGRGEILDAQGAEPAHLDWT